MFNESDNSVVAAMKLSKAYAKALELLSQTCAVDEYRTQKIGKILVRVSKSGICRPSNGAVDEDAMALEAVRQFLTVHALEGKVSQA
jgi:hypothetical protein